MTAVALPSVATRRVEHHMGTSISVVAHDCSAHALDGFFDRVAAFEQILSRHRPGTELSRVARDELSIDEASAPVREVITHCKRLRAVTEGCFDHEPRARSGDPADPVLDADGLAKGWIIRQAALGLMVDGVVSFAVNAGGDVVVGAPPPGRDAWRVGVRHPGTSRSVVATLDVQRLAVATSGAYERGEHIRSCRGAALSSVTVVGPDLDVADALATAVHASGEPAPRWWPAAGEGYGLLTVSTDGRLRWTAEIDDLLVR